MRLTLLTLTALTFAALVGCGTSTSTPSPSDVAENSGNSTTVPEPPVRAEPDVVIKEFLDLVRRGNEDGGAAALLTSKAREELDRIGAAFQPIGLPAARFQVTQSQVMPDNNDLALVHTVWTEPTVDNAGSTQMEIVWEVHHEVGGWRIAGLAVKGLNEEQAMVIDFED
ncbi:MAG: hypothetical protein AAF664_07385, partial [Planctomycetota bacterium]